MCTLRERGRGVRGEIDVRPLLRRRFPWVGIGFESVAVSMFVELLVAGSWADSMSESSKSSPSDELHFLRFRVPTGAIPGLCCPVTRLLAC